MSVAAAAAPVSPAARPKRDLVRAKSGLSTGGGGSEVAKSKVGDRVFFVMEGQGGQLELGTLRFRGLTKFAAGEWFGVELDAQVGKNDGSVQGIVYFTCKSSHGIFCREQRLRIFSGSGRATLSTGQVELMRRASLQFIDDPIQVAPERVVTSGARSELIERLWNRADLDSNGVLDAEEFRAFVLAMSDDVDEDTIPATYERLVEEWGQASGEGQAKPSGLDFAFFVELCGSTGFDLSQEQLRDGLQTLQAMVSAGPGKEEQAALRIQRMHRGASARREAKRMRQSMAAVAADGLREATQAMDSQAAQDVLHRVEGRCLRRAQTVEPHEAEAEVEREFARLLATWRPRGARGVAMASGSAAEAATSMHFADDLAASPLESAPAPPPSRGSAPLGPARLSCAPAAPPPPQDPLQAALAEMDDIVATRQRMQAKLDEVYRTTTEAATRVQAAARGNLARKSVKRAKTGALPSAPAPRAAPRAAGGIAQERRGSGCARLPSVATWRVPAPPRWTLVPEAPAEDGARATGGAPTPAAQERLCSGFARLPSVATWHLALRVPMPVLVVPEAQTEERSRGSHARMPSVGTWLVRVSPWMPPLPGAEEHRHQGHEWLPSVRHKGHARLPSVGTWLVRVPPQLPPLRQGEEHRHRDHARLPSVGTWLARVPPRLPHLCEGKEKQRATPPAA